MYSSRAREAVLAKLIPKESNPSAYPEGIKPFNLSRVREANLEELIPKEFTPSL